MNLYDLGWNTLLNENIPTSGIEVFPGRISIEHRGGYKLLSETGELSAKCSGSFIHSAASPADFPSVGDWVVFQRNDTGEAIIQSILPRKSSISRSFAGKKHSEQIIASNIDTLFLISGLDQNFNLRRLERLVAIATRSGADPVIVLNKADICEDPDTYTNQAESVAPNVPVILSSAETGKGLDELKMFLRYGRTIAFIGSSGVGKSSLVNRLLQQDIQAVQQSRESDSKGRHTTTARQLIPVPAGGILIDTPGMRELGLWNASEGIEMTFEDIQLLALQCRFSNCRHQSEPHCAVRSAIERGELSVSRLQSWQKLQKESEFNRRQEDSELMRQHNTRWKRISSDHKKRQKFRKNQGEI